MPSFDIVSEVNQVEVRNAVDQANKEISTRFDFKGSDARIEHKDKELTIYADDEFKLKQVTDVLMGKLTKRSIDVRARWATSAFRVSSKKCSKPAASSMSTSTANSPDAGSRMNESCRLP